MLRVTYFFTHIVALSVADSRMCDSSDIISLSADMINSEKLSSRLRANTSNHLR